MDRLQFDDGGPGVDQILEARRHLPEGGQDLLKKAEGDLPGHDRRYQDQIDEDVVRLQVGVAGDIEVEVVEIQPKIVLANIREEQSEGRWPGAIRVVLAMDQLLAIGGLHTLIAEVESGQFDPRHREQPGPEDRPDQGGGEKRRGDGSDQRQFGDIGGEREEHRQEGEQGHHRVHDLDPERLDDVGEPHGVLLDALGGTLDGPHRVPTGDIVGVHRGAPAEDIVTDEEVGDDRDQDGDEGDPGEVEQEREERAGGHVGIPGQSVLHRVEEGSTPLVDGHRDLHREVGGEEDQRRAGDRPPAPGVRIDLEPDNCEQGGDQRVIEVEAQELRRDKEAQPDDGSRVLGERGSAERRAEAVPDKDAQRGPGKR